MSHSAQDKTATYLSARTVLCVRDVQRTAAHYRAVLGFEVRFVLPGKYASVCRDGVEVLFQQSDRLAPLPGEPASIGEILIAVDGLAAARDALTARGAALHPRGNRPCFGYADLFVRDNNGYWLQFYEEPPDRSLYLVHPDLGQLPPEPALPAGYRLRTWQEGDEATVPPVVGAAFFGYPAMASYENFHRYLAQRGGFVPENIFVVEAPSGEAAGTTTARFVSAEEGRLHRVGVHPDHQGRGLGKALVFRALHHLAQGGIQTAYVGTQDSRLAAVSIYLQAGFRPVLDRAVFLQRWQRIPLYDLEETWAQVHEKLAAFRTGQR
jgi:mycothiol synthase